jgi:two-component system, NarL family, response regulator NreC
MGLSVLLADDHEVVRYGVCLLLENEPDIQVVGQAATGHEVLALAGQLHPDLILLDLGMPGGGGPSMITELKSRHPKTRIIVLSMYKDQTHVLGALRAGASGYVLKEAQVEGIVKAIREVAAGRRYLSPALTERAIENYVNGDGSSGGSRLEQLTPRELEIIQRAAEGETSAEIGRELFISARTVETHRSRAMQKLGLHNQVELARFFVNLELARVEDN